MNDTSSLLNALHVEQLIQQYEAMCNVDSGNEEADESFRHAVQMMVSDLKSLMNNINPLDEYTAEFANEVDNSRPFIPVGFKMHSVAIH